MQEDFQVGYAAHPINPAQQATMDSVWSPSLQTKSMKFTMYCVCGHSSFTSAVEWEARWRWQSLPAIPLIFPPLSLGRTANRLALFSFQSLHDSSIGLQTAFPELVEIVNHVEISLNSCASARGKKTLRQHIQKEEKRMLKNKKKRRVVNTDLQCEIC